MPENSGTAKYSKTDDPLGPLALLGPAQPCLHYRVDHLRRPRELAYNKGTLKVFQRLIPATRKRFGDEVKITPRSHFKFCGKDSPEVILHGQRRIFSGAIKRDRSKDSIPSSIWVQRFR
jgi:hypothetical protein